jgi:hypothetical protein
VLGTHLMDAAAGSAVLDVVSTMFLIGSATVALVVGTITVAVTVTMRRIRRSTRLAMASLRWRSLTETGPRRDVVRLRLQLRRAVDSGRVVIGAADARTGLPGEAPALFRRIQREAVTVDQHLSVLQTEDDPATLRAALPALRRRVDLLAGLVRQLRLAVADGLEAVSDTGMAELGADVQREVIALRAGRERLRGLDGQPPRAHWIREGVQR